MIILYSKPCAFLRVAKFWCHTVSFANLDTFTAFHYWRLCLTLISGSFTREGVYLYLLIPDTYFLYHLFNRATLLDVVPFNRAHPIKHQTQCRFLNHALTLIQCDVPMHMQCNMSLHVISCQMYNEFYTNNTIHTTYRVSWTITSPAYDFHTSFHSCKYIIQAYINIHIQHVILCSNLDTFTVFHR